MNARWLWVLLLIGCARREIPGETPLAVTQVDPIEEARLASKRNDHDRAMTLWNTVLTRFPQNTEARVRKTMASLALGRRAEAATELDAMLRDRPDWIEALYARGVAAWALGDPALAKRMWTKALQADPELSNYLALVFLDSDTEAVMRQDVGRYRQDFERLAEAGPTHAEVREYLGLACLVEAERTLRRADFERAGAEFSEAIRNRGGREPFYYRANRGYIRLCLGDNAGAEQDFQSARARIDGPGQSELLGEKIAQARRIAPKVR